MYKIENVPEFLKILRKRLEMSQKQFANAYGISARTLEKWATGDRKPEGPAISYLLVISEIPDVIRLNVQRVKERGFGKTRT